jgi:hypothetical protein
VIDLEPIKARIAACDDGMRAYNVALDAYRLAPEGASGEDMTNTGQDWEEAQANLAESAADDIRALVAEVERLRRIEFAGLAYKHAFYTARQQGEVGNAAGVLFDALEAAK